MKTKVYIAGVVSHGGTLPLNKQKWNADRFFVAEDYLLSKGYEPVNPLRLSPIGTPWQQAMREDIKALMDCDAVFALPYWESGKGSTIEVALAASLGLTIMHPDKEYYDARS